MDAGVRRDDAEQLPTGSQVNASLFLASYFCIRGSRTVSIFAWLVYSSGRGAQGGSVNTADHDCKKRSTLGVGYGVVCGSVVENREIQLEGWAGGMCIF